MSHELDGATAAFRADLTRHLIASYLPAFFFTGAACIVTATAVVATRNRRAPTDSVANTA